MTHLHPRRLETALALCQEHGLIPCGPYLINRSVFQADIEKQFRIWLNTVVVAQSADFGYTSYMKVWHMNDFGLVHMGTPMPHGREAYICAWYATLLDPCLTCPTENNPSYTVYAIYATFTIWATQPAHFGARINVPISPSELALLVTLVQRTDLLLLQLNDAATVLSRALTESMFTVSVIGQRGPVSGLPGVVRNRWLTGCAGPGWTNWLQVVDADAFLAALVNDDFGSTDLGDQLVRDCMRLDNVQIVTPTLIRKVKTAAEQYADSSRHSLLPATASDSNTPLANPRLLDLTKTITEKLDQFKQHRSARLKAVLASVQNDQDCSADGDDLDMNCFSDSSSS